MITILAALLVLAWARLSRTPLRDLGFVAPKNWLAMIVLGGVFGIALKLLMKAIVMPLLGGPAHNAAYQFLVGNTAALPGMFLVAIVGAGIGEEIVFRGFLFERLRRLLGDGTGVRIAIILVTTALFAAAHYPDQGRFGMVQAAFTGGVFGTIFAFTRQIGMLMVAHAAFDVAAILIIYLELESAVARLVVR